MIHEFSGEFLYLAAIKDLDEPSIFRKASTIPQWKTTMQEEYNALKAQGTWHLVSPPLDRSIIQSKWVYKIKKNPDGSVSTYKARIVAQGFSS